MSWSEVSGVKPRHKAELKFCGQDEAWSEPFRNPPDAK